MVTGDALLIHLGFNRWFDIHTDYSEFQLGAVIIQNGKPISFYKHKLAVLQQRYTVTEKELLSIVESLKKNCTILLGQRKKIYPDDKN